MADERRNPAQAIADAVLAWPGVTSAAARFGSVQFSYGRRELGHVHGDALADFPFTIKLRDELIAAGRVERHQWEPESGWASRRIHGAADVDDVIALLRLQYERAVAAVSAGSPARA